MKVDCLVVIDEGTTSTRVSAITSQGDVVAESRRSLDVSYPRPGWVEQDAQAFWYVTFPSLPETHIIVGTLAVIQSFKVFDMVYTMTWGGPGQITQVLGTWMYFNGFQYYRAGYGAAIAWIIALISMVVAIPYIRIMSRD